MKHDNISPSTYLTVMFSCLSCLGLLRCPMSNFFPGCLSLPKLDPWQKLIRQPKTPHDSTIPYFPFCNAFFFRASTGHTYSACTVLREASKYAHTIRALMHTSHEHTILTEKIQDGLICQTSRPCPESKQIDLPCFIDRNRSLVKNSYSIWPVTKRFNPSVLHQCSIWAFQSTTKNQRTFIKVP